MAFSQRPRLWEIRRTTELLGEIAELGADPDRWRRHILESMGRLLNAQVSLSADMAGLFDATGPRPIDPLDLGWTSDGPRRRYHEYLYSSEISEDPATQALLHRHSQGRFVTSTRHELVDDRVWYGAPSVSEARRMGDVDDFVCSTAELSPGQVQGFIFYRPWGDKPFDAHHRKVLRLFHAGLLRLVRTSAPAARPDLPRLSPRLRQTLELLMTGASAKHIAIQLGISTYTVNDYLKVLYRRMEVRSRLELLGQYRCRKGELVLPRQFLLSNLHRPENGNGVDKPHRLQP